LTLVRRLTELHGGSVQAISEGPGKGSEFVVRLPLAVEPARYPGTSGVTDESGPVPARRILIVEDNWDAAESLAVLLRMQGHEVQVAHEGTATLDAARAFHPHIVLLDIGLPGMNGYEVARRLRQEFRPEDMLLVAVTGYGQEEDRRHSREAGFNAHLVKPIVLQTLNAPLVRSPATATSA
jgi:two-component system CheB/CheR fusion protein